MYTNGKMKLTNPNDKVPKAEVRIQSKFNPKLS